MVQRNVPGQSNPESIDRMKESVARIEEKEGGKKEETNEGKRILGSKEQIRRPGSKEALPFTAKFEEGPEDLEKLDTFLLSVSSEKFKDPEAVESFMRSVIEKESQAVDEYTEKLKDSDSHALQNLLVNQRYFLDKVENSLESKNYKNKKDSPIVDWINAKRRLYKRKMESASEVTKPAYKDTIKRLETIGRTLIIEK